MTTFTVLITGAAGGLGIPVTEAFLASGWRVVAPLRPRHFAAEQQPLPAGAEPVAAELTDPDAVAAAVAHAAGDPAAPLRAVVNLAGGFTAGSRVHETPITEFDQMLERNLRPTYLVTSSALPHLVAAGGGAVVCVSARAVTRPFAGAACYLTAKAAVLAFAESVAVEYADDGVRCNTILPGVMDTPGNRAAMPAADRSDWSSPVAIAGVIRFLASDESAPTNGAALPV